MFQSGSTSGRQQIAATMLLAITLVAACGDDDDSGATQAPSGDRMSEGSGHEGASPVDENARHVPVRARSFEFEPAELTVAAGEDIAIVLSSEDGLHDFTIDELDAHVSADETVTSLGGFRAQEPGRYTFYCSVEGHREAGMEGTLVVEG